MTHEPDAGKRGEERQAALKAVADAPIVVDGWEMSGDWWAIGWVKGARMSAEVTTYGGEDHTIQHWQLHVDGRFVADTATESVRDLYESIARRLNAYENGWEAK